MNSVERNGLYLYFKAFMCFWFVCKVQFLDISAVVTKTMFWLHFDLHFVSDATLICVEKTQKRIKAIKMVYGRAVRNWWRLCHISLRGCPTTVLFPRQCAFKTFYIFFFTNADTILCKHLMLEHRNLYRSKPDFVHNDGHQCSVHLFLWAVFYKRHIRTRSVTVLFIDLLSQCHPWSIPSQYSELLTLLV